MTSPDVDPFADDPIERDGYGRARIIPTRRGVPNLKAKRIPYTRVSTYADAISDTGGLLKWSKWHLALGLGRNPDLAALAGTYGPTVDDLEPRDKKELDAIIDRAHDRSGGNMKADYGTAVHIYTEPGAQAVPDPFDSDATAEYERQHAELMASIARDSAAYLAELDLYGLETVDTEQFVVNDEAQAAGTFDHTVRLTRDLAFGETIIPAGAVLVLDKKTGKLHFDTQCVQLAVYANAKRYNPETGERTPLDVSTEWGIIAHIPKGEGTAAFHLLDLRIGWAAAKLAGKVREHRTRKDIGRPFPTVEPTEPASDAIGPPVVVEIVAVDNASPALRRIAEHVAAIVPAESPKPVEPVEVPNVNADVEAEALANVVEIFGTAPTLTERLAAAQSRDELSALYKECRAAGDTWTDEHTTALRARAAELEQAA